VAAHRTLADQAVLLRNACRPQVAPERRLSGLRERQLRQGALQRGELARALPHQSGVRRTEGWNRAAAPLSKAQCAHVCIKLPWCVRQERLQPRLQARARSLWLYGAVHVTACLTPAKAWSFIDKDGAHLERCQLLQRVLRGAGRQFHVDLVQRVIYITYIYICPCKRYRVESCSRARVYYTVFKEGVVMIMPATTSLLPWLVFMTVSRWK